MESIGSALYTALKVYEVYGRPVHWWSLEQLVHAPVYSHKPGTGILVYHASTKPAYAAEAVKALKEAGYRVYEVTAAENPATTLIAQAAWALRCLAREEGLPGQPSYRSHPGLETLTRLIYGMGS